MMRAIRLAASLVVLCGAIELLVMCLGYVRVPREEVAGPLSAVRPGAEIDFASAMFGYLMLLTWGTLNAAVLAFAAVRSLLAHRDPQAWRRAQRRVLACCLVGALICVLAAVAAHTPAAAVPATALGPSLAHVIVYSGLAFLVMLCLQHPDLVPAPAGAPERSRARERASALPGG